MEHRIILTTDNLHNAYKFGRFSHVNMTMVYEHCPTTDGRMWIACFKDACDAVEYAKKIAGKMKIVNNIKKEKE